MWIQTSCRITQPWSGWPGPGWSAQSQMKEDGKAALKNNTDTLLNDKTLLSIQVWCVCIGEGCVCYCWSAQKHCAKLFMQTLVGKTINVINSAPNGKCRTSFFSGQSLQSPFMLHSVCVGVNVIHLGWHYCIDTHANSSCNDGWCQLGFGALGIFSVKMGGEGGGGALTASHSGLFGIIRAI